MLILIDCVLVIAIFKTFYYQAPEEKYVNKTTYYHIDCQLQKKHEKLSSLRRTHLGKGCGLQFPSL